MGYATYSASIGTQIAFGNFLPTTEAGGILANILDEAMLTAVRQFGDDVEISPKKAYVSLRRNKQFAILQPSTTTRLDVGINLNGVELTGRLEASGSFNAMLSHHVRLAHPDEVDDQLVVWLKQAYAAS